MTGEMSKIELTKQQQEWFKILSDNHVNFKALVDAHVFNVRTAGKVILNFDSSGVIRDIEITIKTLTKSHK